MAHNLYLVRHGETEWSKTRRHTGRTDIPLTDQGKADATLLRGRLGGLQFHRVFSSPLTRARTTCSLAGFDAAVTVMDDLLEWDYGDYEGLTSTEIRAQNPTWDLFRDGCPGGESPADIATRADRALAAIRALEGSILVFSSGHLLRVLTARWLGVGVECGRYLGLDPASLSLLTYEHGQDDPVIGLWNDTRRP